MKKKLGILLIFILILSSQKVLAVSDINENKLNASKSMEKTYYTIVYLDINSGKELERIEDIDGFVGEEVEIDEDYVNIYRAYRYVGMTKRLNEKANSHGIELILGQESKNNKVYVLYESDSIKTNRRMSISKKFSLI